ncbi:MAG TPA: ATP-binding protein [Anaeromyxobacter sp.]|nr:ATP-binding protein [Anaeromyxobacter sp.]
MSDGSGELHSKGGERSGPGSQRWLESLRTLVEATTETGEHFFRELVVNLTRALGAKHAFVGEIRSPSDDHAQVLAVAWDGVLGPPFTYSLEGTPCEKVLAARELAYFPEGVARRFPRDQALAERRVEAYMGAPLRAPDGSLLGLLVVLHDAALEEALEPKTILRIFANRAAAELSRSRAEALVRDREEALRIALDAASMVSFDWDLEAGRTSWSPGVDALLGFHPGELDPVPAVLAAVARTEEQGALSAFCTEIVEGVKAEFDQRFRAGERLLQVRGRAQRNPNGSPRRVSGVIADVTRQHALEQHLQHAQRLEMVGQLAGGVAHDFNNLLTAVGGNAALLGEHPDQKVRELAGDIEDASRRGSALVRQLLAFARRDVRQVEILDLGEALSGMSRLLQRLLFETHRLSFACSGPSLVAADRAQLEQVALNLVTNARDAMPVGGSIELAVRSLGAKEAESLGSTLMEEKQVMLEVKDHGLGISPEVRDRMFEPFFTTKPRGHGTGLGLATVRGIVAESGGQIAVESAIGSGSTFRVFLPRAEGCAAPRATPRRSAVHGKGERILVVEDDPEVRALVRRILEGEGYGVAEAADGNDALAKAASLPEQNGLVTDMGIPGPTGPVLAQRLREKWPRLKVLFMTGHGNAGAREATTAPLEVLRKPFEREELLRRLRAVLDGEPKPQAG